MMMWPPRLLVRSLPQRTLSIRGLLTGYSALNTTIWDPNTRSIVKTFFLPQIKQSCRAYIIYVDGDSFNAQVKLSSHHGGASQVHLVANSNSALDNLLSRIRKSLPSREILLLCSHKVKPKKDAADKWIVQQLEKNKQNTCHRRVVVFTNDNGLKKRVSEVLPHVEFETNHTSPKQKPKAKMATDPLLPISASEPQFGLIIIIA